MKLIFIFILLMLAGCAAQSINMTTQPEESSISAFGMLADANNPAEMAAAPVIVRLASDLNRAKRLLHKKRITTSEAVAVRDCADKWRAVVADAVNRSDLLAINTAAAHVGECESVLEANK